MGEAAFLGPIIGGATSLFGGMSSASAQRDAAEKSYQASLAGIAETRRAREQARTDLGPGRRFNASALDALAAEAGLMTGDYSEDGYFLPGRAGGPNQDYYKRADRFNYLTGLQPFIDRQTGLATQAGELATYGKRAADYFDPSKTTGGLPDWWSRATEGFKASPDYQFARDEALRMGMQGFGQGTAAGGGRAMGLTSRAAGLASQNYQSYAQNAMKAIMGGASSGLEGVRSALASLGLSSDITGRGYDETSQAASKEEDAYTRYFSRLTQMAGLGAGAPGASANAAITSGQNIAQLGAYGASALGTGGIQAANAMNQGISNAGAYASQLFNPYSPNNLSSGSTGGSGGGWGSSFASDSYGNLSIPDASNFGGVNVDYA